jgi:hypothetical protein
MRGEVTLTYTSDTRATACETRPIFLIHGQVRTRLLASGHDCQKRSVRVWWRPTAAEMEAKQKQENDGPEPIPSRPFSFLGTIELQPCRDELGPNAPFASDHLKPHSSNPRNRAWPALPRCSWTWTRSLPRCPRWRCNPAARRAARRLQPPQRPISGRCVSVHVPRARSAGRPGSCSDILLFGISMH